MQSWIPASPDLAPSPPARAGQPLSQVDTPALVLDLDAFERNVDRMQRAADAAGVKLRPHAKAHKCPNIALAQLARGAVGICCQKISEALPFIAAGVTDIHISNEIAGAAKAERLAAMARHARISVCVDDTRQVDALGAATALAGTRLDVLVEADVGQGRCGVHDAEAAIALARHIGAHPTLRFHGLQAYHGGIQHINEHASRHDAAVRCAARTAAIVAALKAAGLDCEVVTGGGSGSAEFDLQTGVYNEIQAGSYVFMDGDYGKNEGTAAASEISTPRFEHSLFIASTVMSTAAGTRAVLDAGLKSMAVDSGLPWIWNKGTRSASVHYVAANDEHGIVEPAPGNGDDALPRLNELVLLVPGHCDPTLNLYDDLVAYRGDTVEALWPISARGLSR